MIIETLLRRWLEGFIELPSQKDKVPEVDLYDIYTFLEKSAYDEDTKVLRLAPVRDTTTPQLPNWEHG